MTKWHVFPQWPLKKFKILQKEELKMIFFFLKYYSYSEFDFLSFWTLIKHAPGAFLDRKVLRTF